MQANLILKEPHPPCVPPLRGGTRRGGARTFLKQSFAHFTEEKNHSRIFPLFKTSLEHNVQLYSVPGHFINHSSLKKQVFK